MKTNGSRSMRITQKKPASPEPRSSIVPGSGVLTGGRGAGVPPPGGTVKPPPKPVPLPPVPPVPVVSSGLGREYRRRLHWVLRRIKSPERELRRKRQKSALFYAF